MTTFRNPGPAALAAAAGWIARYPGPEWMTSVGLREDDGGMFLTAVHVAVPRPTPVRIRWAFVNRDGEARTTMYGEESALYEYEVMTSRSRRQYGNDDHQRSIDEWMVAWGKGDPVIDIEEDRT